MNITFCSERYAFIIDKHSEIVQIIENFHEPTIVEKELFDKVTTIFWHVGQLDATILCQFPNVKNFSCQDNNLLSLDPDVFQNFPLLKRLDCSRNKLTSFDPAVFSKLTNLIKLNCCGNKLSSLDGLQNNVNLQILCCDNNNFHNFIGLEYCKALVQIECSGCNLKSFNGLQSCANLRKLVCIENQIESFNGLESCPNLDTLYCYSNNITSLHGLRYCSNLKKLACDSNHITSLDGLQFNLNLKRLTCDNNQIISLDGLSSNVNLKSLDCNNNQIEKLDPILNLNQLKRLVYSSNPLAIQSIEVQNFLFRLEHGYKKNDETIYQDRHNVHDMTIQQSVSDSLKSLLSDGINESFTLDTIIESNLDPHVKNLLIEWCKHGYVHSQFEITYKQLLSLVWYRITESQYATELFKILSEQVLEAEHQCFTGRFNRTISVLDGFYTDIRIGISDNAQIAAIITTIKDKLEPYDAVEHKRLATIALLEAGYNDGIINEWLNEIN